MIKQSLFLSLFCSLNFASYACGATTAVNPDSAGIAAYQSGNYRQAVVMLDFELAKRPNDSKAWYYRALSYAKAGCMKEAKVAYADVVIHCPNTAESRYAEQALSQISNSLPVDADKALSAANRSQAPLVIKDSLPDHCEIPYETEASRTMVNASVSGYTVPLEFDTGSDHVILRLDQCKQYGIKVGQLESPMIYKSGQKVWRTHLDIQVGNLKRSNHPVLVFGDGAWPQHMLLGNDFFESYTVEKNDKYHQIILKHIEAPKAIAGSFVPVDQQSPSKNAYYANGAIEIPFHHPRRSQQLLVTCKINGQQVDALFDSGATPGINFTQQQLTALNVPAEQSVNYRNATIGGTTPYNRAKFDVDFGVFQSGGVAGKVVDAHDATWGTDYPLIGPDVFEEQGYSWTINRVANVIELKKMY